MEWHLFKADKSRKKWSIRGTLYNGVDVKIPGHRDKVIATQMLTNIEKLNRAKANGALPPQEVLPWLDNLPEEVMDRLIQHGLVDRGRLERRLPLESFLDQFQDHLKTNSDKTDSGWAKAATAMLRRLFRAIEGLRTFSDLKIDPVKKAVKEMKVLTRKRKGEFLSTKSRREYYSIAKEFCDWMVEEGRASENPLKRLVLPSAKKDRVHNRRPLSYEDFNKLVAYLETAGTFTRPQLLRSGVDRAMLYFTAVRTGLRYKEIRSLTRASFDFTVVPATLTMRGKDSKNGYTETVPLDDDFAVAINEYTERLMPNMSVFGLPKQACNITKALYRDLDAAGVTRQYPNGDIVDFHTLRSTAICWWLRRGLDILEVQRRARLKTLDLIQQYIRQYVPDYQTAVTTSHSVVTLRRFQTGSG